MEICSFRTMDSMVIKSTRREVRGRLGVITCHHCNQMLVKIMISSWRARKSHQDGGSKEEEETERKMEK